MDAGFDLRLATGATARLDRDLHVPATLRNRGYMGADQTDEAAEESFPASDPPSH